MVMHRILKSAFLILAFAVLCAPCFAQQTASTRGHFIIPESQHGSRCEQKDLSAASSCTDVVFSVSLQKPTEYDVSFSVGIWQHEKKEFLEELDVDGKPVYQRTMAETNIFSGGWTQKRVDSCREAILTAMSSEDVEGIVKRGCQ